MAKDQTQSDIVDLARRTQSLFKLNGGVAPQLESVVQVQQGIIEEVENFAQNWFKRRNDATQSVYKTLHEVNAAGKADPAAAVQAITEWQRGSFERLSADLQDWTALCVRCAGGAMAAQSEMKSDDKDLDESRKTNSKTVSGAAGKLDGKGDGKEPPKSKSKGHVTPV